MPPSKHEAWENMSEIIGVDHLRIVAVSRGIRICTQLLELDTIVKYWDSSFHEVLDNCETAIHLATHVRLVPTLWSQGLSEIVILATQCATSCPESTGGIENFDSLRSALHVWNSARSLDDCFREYRVAINGVFGRVDGGQAIDLLGEYDAYPNKIKQFSAILYGSPSLKLWRNYDELAFLGLCGRMQGLAAEPFYKIRPVLDKICEEEVGYSDRYIWIHPVTSFQNPLRQMLYAICGYAEQQAVFNLADTIVALKKYRNTRGQYSEVLSDLVPDFVPSEPIDPFSGHPLKYVHQGESYLLYSVGANGIDDGGTTDYDEEFPYRDKDIVVRIGSL
jgi:hypothetical protein